jgi:hypothetical protein
VAEGWEKLNKGLSSLQNNDDEIKKNEVGGLRSTHAED